MRKIIKLLTDSIQKWLDDGGGRVAAALSFFFVFSLAPMLVIATAIAGTLLSHESAETAVIQKVDRYIGGETAATVETMIEATSNIGSNPFAFAIGFGVLLFGATNFFIHLENALNNIWGVEPDFDHAVIAFFYKRALSFAFVVGIGVLLILSLIFNSLLSGFTTFLDTQMYGISWTLQILNVLISLAIVTLIFAILFKVLPDTDVEWRDVFIGAFVTAILFTIGQVLIGWYIGRTSIASAYGAAGSLAVLLLWIFYSMQIMLFGAEFTQVYSHRFGSKVGELNLE